MKILGVDPGTARMGVSILEVNKKGTPKVLRSDVFITAADMEMHKRLKLLYKKLHEILNEFTPDIMVVEKLFFNTNVKTAMTVGQARGVAMLAAADWDLLVYEYTALEAKRALTGYGRASKKEMQDAVKDYLRLDAIVKSDDANDAIAIALCFLKKDFINLKH